jgi:CBS domain-containing protein
MKGHARNLMNDRVFSVSPDLGLAEIGRALVAGDHTGAPVVDGEHRVIGFVSDSDVLEALLRGEPETTTARHLMSHPPIVVDEFMATDEVMALLKDARIHHLPVVRLGRLVGIITPRDVLKYLVHRVLPIPPEDA